MQHIVESLYPETLLIVCMHCMHHHSVRNY